MSHYAEINLKNDFDGRFGAALNYFLRKNGHGASTRLANAVECSSGYISDLMAGKKEGSEKIRRKIARYFDIEYEEMLRLGGWIVEGGDPELFRKKEDKLFCAGVVKKVPLLTWVQAGAFRGVEMYRPENPEDWITVIAPVGENGFALRIHGDSMSPEFIAGDIIIIDPDYQPSTGDFVVASMGNGEATEATFKQFVRDADRVYLKPLNPVYPVLDMTGIEFKVVGCVVQKIKVYKGGL